LPWTFFVSALNAANTSISEQTELIRRRSFSYQLLPIASVASVAVFFLANTLIFMVYLTYRGELVFQRLPYLVLPMITLALFTGSLALALALMDVYNRDMRQILGNLLTVWFFLTPIVYRPNMAIGWATAFKSIDPMQVIIGEFRDVFVYGKISYPLHYVETLLVTLILFLIVNRIFKRLTQNLAADV